MARASAVYMPAIDSKDSSVSDEQQLALALVECMSESRVDSSGGYHDQCAFVGNQIVVASLDYDGAPELTVCSIPWFVAANDCWFEDEEDDGACAIRALFYRCLQKPGFRRRYAAAEREQRRRAEERHRLDQERRARWKAERGIQDGNL